MALKTELHRFPGRKTVFTNGCFDILHYGHVHYLCQARQLGDILILALNSDESVRALKGPGRPIHKWQDRAFVMAGLFAVDYVTIFSEDTPVKTLEILQPAIHTKGGDYDINRLPEKNTVEAYGGRIIILPFVEGHSTTKILEQRKKGNE